MKHRAVSALLHLKNNGLDKASVDDDVSSLTTPQQVLAYAPKTETTDFEFFKEPKGTFDALYSGHVHDGRHHGQ